MNSSDERCCKKCWVALSDNTWHRRCDYITCPCHKGSEGEKVCQFPLVHSGHVACTCLPQEQEGWVERFEKTSPLAFGGRAWAKDFIRREIDQAREQEKLRLLKIVEGMKVTCAYCSRGSSCQGVCDQYTERDAILDELKASLLKD